MSYEGLKEFKLVGNDPGLVIEAWIEGNQWGVSVRAPRIGDTLNIHNRSSNRWAEHLRGEVISPD